MSQILKFDISILQFIVDNLKSDATDKAMRFITYFGEAGIFWIAVAAFLICFPKTRRIGFTVGLALIFGITVGNGVVKNIVARPRPYTLEQFKEYLAIAELSDWSFPSGHALASFEAAVSIFMYKKSWGIPALILACLVGISRCFLMVHYPSDVIGGALMGTLFAIVSYFIIKKLYEKFDLQNKLLLPFEKR